eukprot:GFYU01002871.1.p1 GENE.GFYU01002871.1~~GFYU01002871.1.p1  ORF type:complete len:233 (+),score=52.75 GFYU01002871.1:63-761(+)
MLLANSTTGDGARSWVEVVNEWEKDEPRIEELIFGSWLTWLCLWGFYEFVVRCEKVTLYRLSLVHLLGSAAYVVNHYTGNAANYTAVLAVYAVVFYVVYGWLLIRPTMQARHISFAWRYTVEGPEPSYQMGTSGVVVPTIAWVLGFMLQVTFGLFYTFLYIFFETIGRCLMFGDFFGQSCMIDNHPVMPKLIGVVVSLAGWVILLEWARRRWAKPNSRSWETENQLHRSLLY